MSAWGEMRRRSAGKKTRKEDKCLTIDEIENILRSMSTKDYSPIHMFNVIVKEFSSKNYVIYSIAARANEQKSFYTQEVMTSFKILMKDIGNIIGIE